MSFLNKNYKFVSQENFDGFLKAVGVPEDRIEKLMKFAPDQKLTKDGDTYTYYTVTSEGPQEIKFKSGVEIDELLGSSKVPVKSTYVVEGNTMTQTVKSAEKGVGVFKREYNGDDLIVTLTLDKWDGVAKRFYKAE
uniref:SFRICE_004606 n=1 Tax=Spodoptera frugiperda TaxID=7108 RepID=A0A2H1VZX6_SPOFR